MTGIPDYVSHGGANAYNHYRCRCDLCVAWRRRYDNDRGRRQAQRQRLEADALREYVRGHGIRLHGPGPFRRNPRVLAQMIANYLNDDLYLYIADYLRRNEL